MKRNLIITTAAAAMACSMTAAAESPSWTYVQGQYALADSGSDNDEYQAGATGSVNLFNTFHLQGSYTSGKADDIIQGTDADVGQINFGYHHGVSENTDVFMDLLIGNVDIDDADDGDYYGGAFGVRSMIVSNVELLGGVQAVQIDDEAFGCTGNCDDSTKVSGFLGGRYSFNPQMSFGVTWMNNDPRQATNDTLTADFRWTFASAPRWLGNK
jgi:hypothetical protein